MDKDPTKEVLLIVKDLKPHKSQILNLLDSHTKEMHFNFLRYNQGEEEYNNLSNLKKIRNLIEYLLTIDEDNNESK